MIKFRGFRKDGKGKKVVCNICGCDKEKNKDCDYCIRQYALSWGL